MFLHRLHGQFNQTKAAVEKIKARVIGQASDIMFAKLTASHLRRHTRWLGINTRFVIYEIVRSIHVSEADTQGVNHLQRESGSSTVCVLKW